MMVILTALRNLRNLNRESTLSKMELFILVNLRADSAMDMEYKPGQMVPNMKVSGRITKPMDAESFTMLMETSLMASGNTIKQMDSAPTIMQMDPSTKVLG